MGRDGEGEVRWVKEEDGGGEAVGRRGWRRGVGGEMGWGGGMVGWGGERGSGAGGDGVEVGMGEEASNLLGGEEINVMAHRNIGRRNRSPQRRRPPPRFATPNT